MPSDARTYTFPVTITITSAQSKLLTNEEAFNEAYNVVNRAMQARYDSPSIQEVNLVAFSVDD